MRKIREFRENNDLIPKDVTEKVKVTQQRYSKKDINESQLQNFLYNLKYLRKSNGISKRKMAKLLGIGIGSLNKIESGKLPPRLGVSVFFDVQRLFGITPQEQLSSRLGD